MDNKELLRHDKVMEAIRDAKRVQQVPNITLSKISEYLVKSFTIKSGIYKGIKPKTTDFNHVIYLITIGKGDNLTDEVLDVLENTFEFNPYTEEDVREVLSSSTFKHILEEISARNLRIDEIKHREMVEYHADILKSINNCYDIKLLPRVSMSTLNQKILRSFNVKLSNPFSTEDIQEISSYYLEGKSLVNNLLFRDKVTIVVKNCLYEDAESLERTVEEIMANLIMNEQEIMYIAKEVNAKEARKLFIYKNDHLETMENIKEAKRISQLPPNLSASTLTGYLQSNATIYPKTLNTKSEDFKDLTSLLLKGYNWYDAVVDTEVSRIAGTCYPDKDDAYRLLYKKLMSLPKTFYLVEEINAINKKQQELIKNRNSNVNVYLIENNKSPIEGGRFYNVYINRGEKLDLDNIIPEGMDIDLIEAFIQEKYDPTFKTAGGIILNRDETIGNVSVFNPNTGKVEITVDEKNKLDAIGDLEEKITYSEAELKHLDEVNKKAKVIVLEYEKQALLLQQNFLSSFAELKKSLDENDNILTLKP